MMQILLFKGGIIIYSNINGARLFYNVAGEKNDHSVLVLHGGRGLGDHSGDFNTFYPLSDDYKLIAYDQRGCGRSSLTPPYTFSQFVDDLEEFRKKLDLGKITLIGGSFGGMISLLYAIKYPEGLKHLVLRGTAPSYHHEKGALQNLINRLDKATSASVNMCKKLFSDDIKDDRELRLIWLALQPLYYEDFDPDEALAKTREMYMHAETHNALFSNKNYDVRDDLNKIKTPTLITVGRHDWICPLDQSKYMAEHINNSKLVIFEKSNHAPHVEENEEFLKIVREFIERGEEFIE